MTAVDVKDEVCEKCGNKTFNLVYDPVWDQLFLLCACCDRELAKINDWSLINYGK